MKEITIPSIFLKPDGNKLFIENEVTLSQIMNDYNTADSVVTFDLPTKRRWIQLTCDQLQKIQSKGKVNILAKNAQNFEIILADDQSYYKYEYTPDGNLAKDENNQYIFSRIPRPCGCKINEASFEVKGKLTATVKNVSALKKQNISTLKTLNLTASSFSVSLLNFQNLEKIKINFTELSKNIYDDFSIRNCPNLKEIDLSSLPLTHEYISFNFEKIPNDCIIKFPLKLLPKIGGVHMNEWTTNRQHFSLCNKPTSFLQDNILVQNSYPFAYPKPLLDVVQSKFGDIISIKFEDLKAHIASAYKQTTTYQYDNHDLGIKQDIDLETAKKLQEYSHKKLKAL